MQAGSGSTWSIPRTWPLSRSSTPPRRAASSSTTSSSLVARPDYENITASGLKGRLDAGDRPVLLDVREPWEFELARIEGSTLIPMSELVWRFTELDPDAEKVVVCHRGNRISYVTHALLSSVFYNVLILYGGLFAYSFVDDSVPRY